MNELIGFIFHLVTKEALQRKKLVITLYVGTSFFFAVIAWVLPQVFTSSATIIVEDRNIIAPLMKGTAQTSVLTEPLKLAKTMMSSRTTLREVLDIGGWIKEDTPQKDVDNLIENMRTRTDISNTGKKIIHINYKDREAQRAYIATKAMSEIFIRESILLKQKDSENAYNFINDQSEIYHKKLIGADRAIKAFREKNVDSTPGAMRVANERVLALTRQIEDLDIEILGENSKLNTQRLQLSGGGGAENTASIEREVALRTRVTALKSKLEDLRLTFEDTYPDIIQILSQVTSTENKIKKEIISRASKRKSVDRSQELSDSPFAQELRSEILSTQTNISTLNNKKEQLNILLDNERLKINRINAVDVEITELTRESQVNEQKYNQLVEQREIARISRDMDLANQGINARIQEAAFVPASPKGLRFIHIIIVGLLFSFVVPIAVVFGLTLLDQKVRDINVISNKLKLPILASVYPVKSNYEMNKQKAKIFTLAIIVIIVWVLYGVEIWLKVGGIEL
ncbi:MAG: polysaccharide chain length determinant protein (PEP-CTERM system associated) [Polaribacter sp.]|jgi:polysaccharide chain length determinant protein (PEP-CTERM system associated)